MPWKCFRSKRASELRAAGSSRTDAAVAAPRFRLFRQGLAWCALFPLLFGAAAADPFMGRWEGTYRGDGADAGPFQAQVVPQGGNLYDLWVRFGERGSRYRIAGRRERDVLLFQGHFQVVAGTDDAAYDLTGEIRDGRLTGKYESPEGNGTIALTKIALPTVAPSTAPAGARWLFNGKDLAAWRNPEGGAPDWRVRPDGTLEAAGRDLVSRQGFGDLRIHLEFWLPLLAEARGQGRANSGVVVGGGHEIHILDTFGGEPTKTSCGALFGVAAPRREATLPPLTWQTLEIIVHVADTRVGARAAGRAEISVVLNGTQIHEQQVVDDFRVSPIRLRHGGGAVRFRNIWIESLARK